MVYWRDPDTKSQKSRYFALESSAKSFDRRKKAELNKIRKSRSSTRVGDLLDRYLDGLRTSSTALKQARYHAKHVREYFGAINVENLEQDHVFGFVQSQLEKGLSRLTANRRVTILRAALARAMEMRLIKKNPLHGMRLPKGDANRYIPPTPGELFAMLSHAPPHIQRIIYLGYYLGVRVGPSELFRLAWQDFDAGRALIRVWAAAKNKNQPWRDIPINPCLAEEINAWIKFDQNEFGRLPATIVHWHGKSIRSCANAWHNTLAKAGIKRIIRPYDLRHAYATEALAAGADIKAVATVMGHAGISTVLRSYQYVRDEQKRKAVNCLPRIGKKSR